MIEVSNPIVTIKINGEDTIKIELYPEVAPNTVNNFISLVNKGYYNNLGFHRIIKGFMIQGGCPEGTGMGGPGYMIKGEFSQNRFENDIKHEPGVISMARSMRPDSAGSQFFIMHKEAPHLDGAYAAFGKVTEGMDVVDKLASVKTSRGDVPVEPQIMTEVTVETFGVEYPQPATM
jgi:peptidyl-prolyl cis-trans isomerase B (cyclophilin B)